MTTATTADQGVNIVFLRSFRVKGISATPPARSVEFEPTVADAMERVNAFREFACDEKTTVFVGAELHSRSEWIDAARAGREPKPFAKVTSDGEYLYRCDDCATWSPNVRKRSNLHELDRKRALCGNCAREWLEHYE